MSKLLSLAKKSGSGLKKATGAAARGLKSGAKRTGRGLKKTSKGITKATRVTYRTGTRVADSVSKFKGDISDIRARYQEGKITRLERDIAIQERKQKLIETKSRLSNAKRNFKKAKAKKVVYRRASNVYAENDDPWGLSNKRGGWP